MMAVLLVSLLAGTLIQTQPPMPPTDWSALPPLPLRRRADPSTDISAFVRDEVVHGRCDAAVRDGTGWKLGVDLAVLAGADGRLRRVVPRAIQCPTVEQYAVGLVSSNARNNLDPLLGEGDRWYRIRVTFSWPS